MNEYIYDADEVTSELLDEMAKYLIDKPSRFRDMGLHQEKMRESTRQARQPKPVNYANSPATVEDDDEVPSGGFFDRLKSILN